MNALITLIEALLVWSGIGAFFLMAIFGMEVALLMHNGFDFKSIETPDKVPPVYWIILFYAVTWPLVVGMTFKAYSGGSSLYEHMEKKAAETEKTKEALLAAKLKRIEAEEALMDLRERQYEELVALGRNTDDIDLHITTEGPHAADRAWDVLVAIKPSPLYDEEDLMCIIVPQCLGVHLGGKELLVLADTDSDKYVVAEPARPESGYLAKGSAIECLSQAVNLLVTRTSYKEEDHESFASQG